MVNELQAATAEGRKGKYWAGWVMSGLVIAFLLMDSVMKLLALPVVTETGGALGFQGADIARELGVVLLTCTVLYIFPRTAVLGAILLTGFLGGAVATHVRVGTHSSRMFYSAFIWACCFGADFYSIRLELCQPKPPPVR